MESRSDYFQGSYFISFQFPYGVLYEGFQFLENQDIGYCRGDYIESVNLPRGSPFRDGCHGCLMFIVDKGIINSRRYFVLGKSLGNLTSYQISSPISSLPFLFWLEFFSHDFELFGPFFLLYASFFFCMFYLSENTS